MNFDGFGDKHDKCARRPADLKPAAAQRRNHKAADDRGEEASFRLGAGSDGEGHGQRNADYSDRQPGQGVGAEIGERIATPQSCD